MKEKIIEIALRQLRLGGYENLNFGSIATELSVTRANVHHHFKNKEGLAHEAVKEYVEDEKRLMDQLIEAHSGDLYEFLSALETHLISSLTKQTPFTACVGSQLVRDSVAPESLRTLALQRFRDEAADIERLVVGHFEAQGADTEQARILAFKIVATLHGIDMMAQITSNIATLPTLIRGTLTSLLD